MRTTYNKFPEVSIQGYDNHAWQGWSSIHSVINTKVSGAAKTVLIVDCYPGVRLDELEQQLVTTLDAALVLNIESARRDEQALHDLLARNLTDDRVFGVLSCHHLDEFFDSDKLSQLRQQIDAISEGLVVVYGSGAALAHPGDVLVYADLPRWEIQQRMRHDGLGNWGAENQDEDILRRYKRAFFIEWRVFDKHKTPLLKRADYLLDTTVENSPTMVSGDALRAGLQQTTEQPFRVAPFFDPGVWGGQWGPRMLPLPVWPGWVIWC